MTYFLWISNQDWLIKNRKSHNNIQWNFQKSKCIHFTNQSLLMVTSWKLVNTWYWHKASWKLVNITAHNGLSAVQQQAFTWASAAKWTLRRKVSKSSVKTETLYVNKIQFKIFFANYQPFFCTGLNVFSQYFMITCINLSIDLANLHW